MANPAKCSHDFAEGSYYRMRPGHVKFVSLTFRVSQESCTISAKNHVRRSVSSIQTSIKLAVATSLW